LERWLQRKRLREAVARSAGNGLEFEVIHSIDGLFLSNDNLLRSNRDRQFRQTEHVSQLAFKDSSQAW
jgi:hypothetical protein